MRKPYFLAQLIALRKYLENCEVTSHNTIVDCLLPRCLREEGLIPTSLDGVVADGNANMVQASTCNLSEVLLGLSTMISSVFGSKASITYDEGLVMFFQQINAAVGIPHVLTERPLVDRRGGVVDIWLV